ncbi:DciA family protein [Xenorhabdus sp. XENO-10]|uniref:DciA family protein n=1 Tax=Xenorhabdus yunnanensis TaxID=3025878 RepID=A0ABT5LAN3_9GAMM|nr:DciA family protein [Xenorhabdus yunnanensis]MDC9588101.1 DciA family protein [Xenorhabdus yunnanensis]
MRDSRPQSLDTLFEDAATVGKSPLQVIQQHAIALLKLNRTVLSLLPAQLHPWCRVANYRKQILVLEAGNASWMTRLRYEIPCLLSTLRSEILPSLSSIDIRINPSLMVKCDNNEQGFSKSSTKAFSNDNQELPKRQLTHESAKTLMMLAENSPEKLKRKLERLAALAGESTSTAKKKR